MPAAQVIQRDDYRQIPPEQTQPSRIDRVRQLLAEATTAPPTPEIIELLTAIKNQQATMLNILKSARGK